MRVVQGAVQGVHVVDNGIEGEVMAVVELAEVKIESAKTNQRGLLMMRWPRAHPLGGPFSTVSLLFRFVVVSIGVSWVVWMSFSAFSSLDP